MARPSSIKAPGRERTAAATTPPGRERTAAATTPASVGRTGRPFTHNGLRVTFLIALAEAALEH